MHSLTPLNSRQRSQSRQEERKTSLLDLCLHIYVCMYIAMNSGHLLFVCRHGWMGILRLALERTMRSYQVSFCMYSRTYLEYVRLYVFPTLCSTIAEFSSYRSIYIRFLRMWKKQTGLSNRMKVPHRKMKWGSPQLHVLYCISSCIFNCMVV